MLQKIPKPANWKFIKSSAKTLLVLELIGFAASYGIFYRMNTNRDFRHYVNENYPYVLEYYYKVGEFLGDSNVRQLDSAHWSATSRNKQE